MGQLKRQALYFSGKKSVEVREESIPPLQNDQVLVGTLLSAISAGTEMLFYRGQVSSGQPLDTAIQSLSGYISYPLKYGYSTVGKVAAVGPGVDPAWTGKRVFAFHPHESLFAAYLPELLEIPEGISTADAVFLPNVESAVNLVMDGQPLLGENVIVFGQGIVGLLTTSILSQFPLKNLVTLDFFALRRQMSIESGAMISLDPTLADSLPHIRSMFQEGHYSGADLIFEISGNPAALEQAIALAGFDSRIIIGSWYGSRAVELKLDENYHRSRIKIISSQVSTIAPALEGRWDKPRRFGTVWRMIGKLKPSRFISRRITILKAAEAYKILDENPGETVQIIFSYPEEDQDV